MKIIDYIKRIVKVIQTGKDFIIAFSLGLVIGLCIIIWTIFTVFRIIINTPETLPILDFLTISLTLFGFTLVGGIFEKKRLEESPPIVKSLFRDSLIFLSSGTSFLLAYSLIPFINTDFKIVFQLAYIFGTLFFAIAIWSLLIDLISFYLDIKRQKII